MGHHHAPWSYMDHVPPRIEIQNVGRLTWCMVWKSTLTSITKLKMLGGYGSITSITKLFLLGGDGQLNVGRLSLTSISNLFLLGRLWWRNVNQPCASSCKFSPNHSRTPHFTLGLHILVTCCCWHLVNLYSSHKALLIYSPLFITFLHHIVLARARGYIS